MIDTNALTLYKEKISSYLDENVLTFPTESKINSLFNEVHKYKVIIYNRNHKEGGNSNISKLKLFRNERELTLKSSFGDRDWLLHSITAIVGDENEYHLQLKATYNYDRDYCLYKIFTTGWSSGFPYPTPMTLEFEMSKLTKISYKISPDDNRFYPSDDNTITVFCDDKQIYSKNIIIPNGTNTSQIHINFNDYDDVNVTYTV